jgi:release factor glutamine methyltransferase
MLLQLILTNLVSMFKENNIVKADLEARLILESLSNLNTVDFIKNLGTISLNDNKVELAYSLAKRRIMGEPLAYILKYKNFWKDRFYVDNRVLIPRADSEVIIETLLKLEPNKDAKLTFLDIGLGSGCLALSLLKEYKKATAFGLDISQNALDVAQINAYDLKVSKRIIFKHVDIFSDSFIKDIGVKTLFFNKKFNYIISNPPYIDINDIRIQDSVKNYEPHIALFASSNGLAFYEAIFKNSLLLLAKKGYVIVEIGADQHSDVIGIASKYNFHCTEQCKDMANIIRCLVFQNI